MARRCRNWFWIILAIGIAAGQTKVSLKNQAREYDLSQATAVRPFTVTSTLPATCRVGEMRFRTDVTPGQNLFGCAADNLWVPMTATATVYDPGVRLDRSGASSLVIGADCTLQKPCRFRFGSIVHTITSPGQLTISGGGSGQIYIFVTSTGQFGVAMTPTASLTLGCTGCSLMPSATSFPMNSIPLWTWVATGGIWNLTGSDQRTTLVAGPRLVAGANSVLIETNDTVQIASNNYLPQGAVTSGTSLRLGGNPGQEGLLGLGANLGAGATGGTFLAINAPLAFDGDLAHWQIAGTSRFRWTPDGNYFAYRNGATATWWGNASTSAASSFRLAVAGSTANEKLMLGTGGSANFLQANGLNRVGIGTAAPEPGTADLLIQDARPLVGNTQVQIRAGAAQVRDLWQVLDPAGTTIAAVTAQGALQLRPVGTRPTCDETRRGMLWFAAGSAGVADQLQVCQKTSSDTYQWTP